MASSAFNKRSLISNFPDFKHVQFYTDWEDVICPICLNSPHNSVLLQCSSYDKGCRPFLCDTDDSHSNCLDRFITANGMSDAAKVLPSSNATPEENVQSMQINCSIRPACPLCRGEVTGWNVVDEARAHLNTKTRCCEEERCDFIGNYMELQSHANLKHPHARPSEVDPARRLNWENLQQSSEIIDVLSIIHREIPHGVVLGDYVIEYGADNSRGEPEDFPRDDRNWWRSCINFRAFRNRRRSRVSQPRSRRWHSRDDTLYLDHNSMTFEDFPEYGIDETDEEFVGRDVAVMRSSFSRHSSQRLRSRVYDH